MARMKHAKGDLSMTINGIDFSGQTMIINGKMGVWSAQIFFEPEDLGKMIRYMIGWKPIFFMILLPWRLLFGKSKKSQ
jgi:hypothetical protein